MQYLLATNKEFLPKQVYEFEIEHIHEVLSAIRKRLGEKVNYSDLIKVRSIEDVWMLKKMEVYYGKEDGVVGSRVDNGVNEEKVKEV